MFFDQPLKHSKKRWYIWPSVIFLGILVSCVSTTLIFVIPPTKRPPYAISGGDDFNITLDGTLIFTRKDWGAFPPTGEIDKLVHPTKFVVICHTASSYFDTFAGCSLKIRNIQSGHVSNEGQPDILYNFLICGDENIYIGRGWDNFNGRMEDSIQIAFIGNYAVDKLTDGMAEAALKLIDYGVENGKLSSNYVLVGQNQTMRTVSPGKNVYKVISEWPHFFNGSVVNGHLVP